MNLKKIIPLAIGLGMLVAVVAPATHVFAAYDPNVNGLANELPGTSQTPTQLALTIIKAALGILSLLAVVFIMYGGFRWLTAGGNEENLKKAKEIISAAVIGLVVVLLAYIIVLFVARITTSTLNGNANI